VNEKRGLINVITSDKLTADDQAILVKMMGRPSELSDADKRRLIEILDELNPDEKQCLLSALAETTGITVSERQTLIQMMAKDSTLTDVEKQILYKTFTGNVVMSIEEKVYVLRQIIEGSNLTDQARVKAMQLLGAHSNLTDLQKELLMTLLTINSKEREELLGALELDKRLTQTQRHEILQRLHITPHQFDLLKANYQSSPTK
jgi:hypothetical protein